MAQFALRNWAAMGFGFAKDGTGGGPGWFHNSGEFGIQMCVFLPLAIAFFLALRSNWPLLKKGFFLSFSVAALSGTISSSSRGAVLGAAAVMLWMLLNSKHKLKGMILFVVIGLLALSIMPSEQMERFETAGEDSTSINRKLRWEKGLEMAARYPLLGTGFANWKVADEKIFGGTGDLSHNIFIECMSELGYTGLAVFVAMIGSTFINNFRTRRLVSQPGRENRFIFYMAHGLDGALIGFLVSGFFVTVLYYPYFWINLAMTVSLNSIARNGAYAPSEHPAAF
jgi:O-antigen ligase